MEFPWDLYLCATISGAFCSWISTPLWVVVSRRIGLMDQPGHRKIHTNSTPLAGGPALMTGMIAGGAISLVWMLLVGSAGTGEAVEHGLGVKSSQILALVLGSGLMFAVGIWDDLSDPGPGYKFLGQIVAALIVASSGIRITLFISNPWISYVITILWILTLVNALNFMDNMNGLCSGVGAWACWGFAWLGASHGQYLTGALGFLFFGILVGFLPFNFPKAKTFLGDSGSHLVGFWLASLALFPDYFIGPENAGISWKPFTLPLLILCAPLLDMISVVWIRWRSGKPVYVGDNNHFSHRLCRVGFSRTAAVLLIWTLGCAGAALGLLLNTISS